MNYGTEVPLGVDARPVAIATATPQVASSISGVVVATTAKASSAAVATKVTKAPKAPKAPKATKATKATKAAKKKRTPGAPSAAALERQRLSRRSKCIEAKAKLRRIDNRFRAGFKGAEGERLRERQQTWTMVKNEFCSPN